MKKNIVFFSFLVIGIIYFFVVAPFLHEDSKLFAQNVLSRAGITINGNEPYDVMIHNDQIYSNILSNGSLALGESYMNGWWDCLSLDQFFYHITRSDIYNRTYKNIHSLVLYVKAKLTNLQSSSRAFQVGEQHYDIGNDLFTRMLDKNMLYSCAYWKNADTLDKAQEDKCELICKKLYLKPGMKVLDIGCGWGGFALYAAKNYGVEVVGVTISKEQAEYARNITKGYPVEIRLQDYRDIDERFDRIVSIGMFEHVGYKNYATFMNIAQKVLKDHGSIIITYYWW